MLLALAEARAARDRGEVPVGAVVVLEGAVPAVIGRGSNRTRVDADPTAHAELLALREAARAVGAPRLPGSVLYTTVEPCFMCAGAALHARVARVVWGVRDPKFGGCASLGRVLSDPRANHQAEITEGVLADEARWLLQEFFQSKR
jgi:tRNA(adenine34) deaminase